MLDVSNNEISVPMTATFYAENGNGQKVVIGLMDNSLDVEPIVKYLPDQSSGVDEVIASELMPTAIRVFNTLFNDWIRDGNIPERGKHSWGLSFGPKDETVLYKTYKVEAVPVGSIERARIQGKITIREQNISEARSLLMALAGRSLSKES